jgi:hypothetical protein
MTLDFLSENMCAQACSASSQLEAFKNFFDLADAIHQLAYGHPQWEGGSARAMLAFHSEKLMEIRQFAVSRKQLILQVYTYLRDS